MEKKIIINIGRQFGGGGRRVAYELGRKLDIPVYDREIISQAAKDSGFGAEFFKERDEKKGFLSFGGIFTSGFGDTENYMSDRGIFKLQSQTIEKIAQQGSAVIVGRCADYILRENENTLNVFLTSPLEVRAERIASRQGMSLEDAMAKAQEKDKKRAEYYNYYTYKEWGHSSAYNLCLDSSFYGTDKCAEIIAGHIRERFFGI